MEKNTDFLANFENTLKFFYNIDFDKFNDILGGIGPQDAFVNEQWDGMRHDFIRWFCNLDSYTQKKFIDLAREKYNF